MIKDIQIRKQKSALYPADDVPAYIEKYMKRLNKKNQRTRRTDLQKGMIVIVLSGVYEGKKVIYLDSLDNNMILCSGVRGVNEVPIFKIDEMFVFPTSTFIKVDEVNVNFDEVPTINGDNKKTEVMEIEYTNQMNKLENTILKELEKVDFLKAYMKENFVIDASIEFYSQEY